MNEQQASGIDAHRDQRRRLIADALERDCPMTAEQQGSNESGEGLSEVEREALAKVEYATWAGMGEVYGIEWADHLLPAVKRIIAARVQRAEAQRDAMWEPIVRKARETAALDGPRWNEFESSHDPRGYDRRPLGGTR